MWFKTVDRHPIRPPLNAAAAVDCSLSQVIAGGVTKLANLSRSKVQQEVPD